MTRLASETALQGEHDRRSLAELLPITTCLIVGLVMALLPAVVQWFSRGVLIWIGNGDELFMLALGSQAYFNHPAYLSDPVLVSGGASLFRQLPLLPGVWLAWASGGGPLAIDLWWRILSGLSLGITWYLLVRQVLPRPWIAAALTVILLVDAGLLSCGLFFRQAQATAAVLGGSSNPTGGDFFHAEWRVATPALTMAYLLLNLWLVVRARQSPTTWSLALAGLSYGLLFHVYPYFWTTATSALALAFLIDPGHRRVYLWTGLVGGVLGSFRLFHDFSLKQNSAPDWLIRSDKFVHVARFTDMRFPLVASLVLAASLVWVWMRRRELVYLWAMGLAGLLLFKNHVFTGLNVENYHWMYLWGPCSSLLQLAMAASMLPQRGWKARLGLALLALLTIADVLMGVGLRAAEGRVPRQVSSRFKRFRITRNSD